jgi:hypothetical protein
MSAPFGCVRIGLVKPSHRLRKQSSNMSIIDLPEPATEATLADARRALEIQRRSLLHITGKIDSSEAALAQIVADSRCAINEMAKERATLEEKIFHTMAYLSPIRRLPFELLRQIFLFNFDDYPCCAWVLCAVCSLWRKTALSMPRIWSKVRYPLYGESDWRTHVLPPDTPPNNPAFVRRYHTALARTLWQ